MSTNLIESADPRQKRLPRVRLGVTNPLQSHQRAGRRHDADQQPAEAE
jgi:hypothetical protein